MVANLISLGMTIGLMNLAEELKISRSVRRIEEFHSFHVFLPGCADGDALLFY